MLMAVSKQPRAPRQVFTNKVSFVRADVFGFDELEGIKPCTTRGADVETSGRTVKVAEYELL